MRPKKRLNKANDPTLRPNEVRPPKVLSVIRAKDQLHKPGRNFQISSAVVDYTGGESAGIRARPL